MTPDEKITFPSLDGEPASMLDGYLFRPKRVAGEKRPAMILMHGCTGLWMHDGKMNTREVDWSKRFVEMGYVSLVVDSFKPRGVANMCSPDTFEEKVYDARAHDAYGAMAWLQKQSYIAPGKIGMMGWSQGGGAVLLTARADNESRPAKLPHGDFAAAVAMYPGSCHQSVFRSTWTTPVPMMVLIGGKDVWTPASPCHALTATAASFGDDVTFHVYPTAYHDFDWPGEDLQPLPQYTTADGVVPVIGIDPDARADAIKRVPKFLKEYLGE